MQVDIKYPWLVFDMDSEREPSVYSFTTHKAAAQHINEIIKSQIFADSDGDADDAECEYIDENDEKSRHAYINDTRYGADWIEFFIVNIFEQQTIL